MKTSTKFIPAIMMAMAILSVTNVSAQNATGTSTNSTSSNWHLGIGVETGLPTANLNQISNVYLGGTARLQYDFQSHVSAMLTSGYYNAFGKSGYSGLGIVPVKAGLKYFPVTNLYLSGEAGVGFETSYNDNKKLILAPGIGYANSKGLDVGLRYENFSGQNNSYGLVGLRIAYGFKL